MFDNSELLSHLKENASVKSRLKVFAEWNLNTPDNLERVGNYRYRPNGSLISAYTSINNSYDPYDFGNFYTNATFSDIALDGINLDDDAIEIFSEQKDVEGMLFSLEDCFGRFRPRSGINKIRYGITKFLHHDGEFLASRPRYYMADKDDNFKYWTSYRNESLYAHSDSDGHQLLSVENSYYDKVLGKIVAAQNLGSSEYGIANQTVNGIHYIQDAAPFVVYKDQVPANRIIVKMQTNVGETDLGSISSSSGIGVDPLYDESYKTVPSIWKIQYLKDGIWTDAISFDQFSLRSDGTPIIGNDGYVEIAYGAIVPDEFSNFKNMGTIASASLLPQNPSDGDAYLVSDGSGPGIFYVASSGSFSQDNSFIPSFGWVLVDETTKSNFVVRSLVNPPTYSSNISGEDEYTEFVNISGLRIVVTAMKNKSTVFDLIELSPRLVADMSDMTTSFDVTKNMSDLGISGLPVGQLLASVGSVEFFDSEGAFNSNNSSSIINNLQTKNIQFKFYESINANGTVYDVPIKTLYADGIPETTLSEDTVSVELRDLFFYFESLRAPEIFVTGVSLSYAISLLLDSVGFSNYTFKRLDSENDPIIPYFYTSSQSNVAELLNSLAVSSQYAMYFDEYNNLVVASRGYIMPTESDRAVDHEFTSNLSIEDGVTSYPDILDIASATKDIFTDGEINYTTRYIQKSEASTKQTYMLAKDKNWVYKPSLLWEVSAPPNVRASNEPAGTQGAYTLAAIPLNSDLDRVLPTVANGQIINNILDLGEGVYWLARYNGYFYANAEIIKFDAVEYSVSGFSQNVWVSSVDEYQYYFSKLPFNGKIYPTGRVRIFAEPYYDEYQGESVVRNGEVRKHGRGQFGTSIAYHSAGINSYWSDSANVKGFSMKSEYLFGDSVAENNLVSVRGASSIGSVTPTGKSADEISKQSKRSGTIKNYIANFYDVELDSESSATINNDMIQSSALVIDGPDMSTEDSPEGFITYVPRTLKSEPVAYRLNDKVYFKDGVRQVGVNTNTLFKHFGTRMRIVGEVKDTVDLYQAASGATAYYDSESSGPTSEGLITGGGGGLACLLNKKTNSGYYFELAALDKGSGTYDSITLDDVFFYKVMADESNSAIPVLLWSGSAGITVDSGRMVGQSRVFAQETQTVYDMAVEYSDSGTSRTFYLYLNGTQIATVVDENPLPIYSDMALFVRGSSKCMFENIYALKYNYSKNPSKVLNARVDDVFGSKNISLSQSFSKYAISGIVQESYLSSISRKSTPTWDIYYEEFGTIMREAAYFDVKYDKAYPALYSKVANTGNEIKGYVVSGYRGTAYGAEFLVFNATDTTITLDENSGNFLKIQGIAFTQNTSQKLTVDDYFNNASDFSPSTYSNILSAGSELKKEQQFLDIKASRRLYGVNEFSIDAEYIQTQDQANELMGWLSESVMKPRLSVGLNVFSNPMLQLGDIVKINYSSTDGEIKIDPAKRFVIYSIEYNYSTSGPEMLIYVSEVR